MAVVVGLGTALFAFGPGGSMGGPFGKHRDGMFKLLSELDLTREQKNVIRTIRKEQKKAMRTKMKSFREGAKENFKNMKPEMDTFMTADSFDKEAYKVQMKNKFEIIKKIMQENNE